MVNLKGYTMQDARFKEYIVNHVSCIVNLEFVSDFCLVFPKIQDCFIAILLTMTLSLCKAIEKD